MPAEIFRCYSCRRLYDRTDFSKGMTTCKSCGSHRFTRSGRIGLVEELVFAARHPKLAMEAMRGAK